MRIKLFVDETHTLFVWVQDAIHMQRIATLVDSGDFLGWEYTS